MTDKQIIIDVCPYQGECSVSGCKRNDDGCFVRQLFEERYRAENQIVELNKTIQAKEQECEEFRKANDEKNELLAKLGCPTTATAKRKVFCLQQQLDQLKADRKEALEQLEFVRTLNTVKEAEIIKLSKTLTEIKKIASHYNDMSGNCVIVNFFEDMRKILQKISEVSND